MRPVRMELLGHMSGGHRTAERNHWREAGAVVLLVLAALLFAALARAETLDARAIAGAAERCVREAFGTGVEVEAQCGPVPALGALQSADVELRTRVLGERRTGGQALVSVELWHEGERIGERSVTVQVRLYRPVLVAREPLARGTALVPAQFTVERREVAMAGDTVTPSVETVAGMRLRRPVVAGDTVLATDLEPVPLVRRGDKVTATTGVGGISVSMSAIALEDGAMGATVSVKNDRSGRRLQAVVVGPGVVRVQLDDPSIGG